MKITVKAYGKINLTLAVTGLLPNGYHTISSVMQSVSVYNSVTVERNNSGVITLCSDDKALPTDKKNTACRAAEAFLQASGMKGEGLYIFIGKRVPYQAGMGSASADAAGVLFAANTLFDGLLPRERLMQAALSVGADVPFCLAGGTMLAGGMGEKLSAAPLLPECGFLILHPGRGISTPEAYRRFDALENPKQPDTALCIEALKSGKIEKVAAACGNVFEQCCDMAEVFELKRMLKEAGALAALMTGSGTAVFGIFRSVEEAQAAAEKIPDGIKRWTAIPARCGVEIE